MSLYPILYPSGHRVQTSVGFPSDLDLLLEELTKIPLSTVSHWPVNSNTEE